jgi:hypothetical protein
MTAERLRCGKNIYFSKRCMLSEAMKSSQITHVLGDFLLLLAAVSVHH